MGQSSDLLEVCNGLSATRIMFSYYGSKTNIVGLYPKPAHDRIVEPFAGSARYSLKYYERDVILIDKYRAVIDVWKYLQNASEGDILGLPRLKHNETLDQYDLAPEERLFMGFNIKNGSARPANIANSRNTIQRPNRQNFNLRRIAASLFKIRHWKFIHGEYDCLANIEATWFIDPPYTKGGEWYKWSSKKLNFDEVATYAESRNGQVIVCENSHGRWMPFLPLKANHGNSGKTNLEVFWTNDPMDIQADLFS